jgi:hypothetical protein
MTLMSTPIAAALLVALAAPPVAAPAPAPAPRAAQFEALTRCRALTEPAERFACLERSALALEQAADRGDIVIIDRQQIRTTKRTLFGLSIPRLDIFGSGGEQEEISEVDGVVASASRNGDGRWSLELAGGARWLQIDDRVLGRSPRAGDKVRIERASLGTFMMKIGRHPGIRVRRLS